MSSDLNGVRTEHRLVWFFVIQWSIMISLDDFSLVIGHLMDSYMFTTTYDFKADLF